MKKLLLCITFICTLQNAFAQPDGLIDEIFNLKYLDIDNDIYYTPNGANSTIIFVEDGSGYSMNANGIINTLFAETTFNEDTVTLENIGVTLTDCDTPNCYFEDLYFYDMLTPGALEAKPFTYYYHELNDGSKSLVLQDSDSNTAHYSTLPSEEPNPLLFQTWYLYKVEVDLEDPTFYNGPHPPQLTINPDLTYTGIEGCSTISGDFILGNDPLYDFLLQAQNYFQDTSDCPSGSSGYVMYELHNNLVIHCGMFTDSEGVDYFWYETYPGFTKYFRNELILSTPENTLTDLTVFPNPATDKLTIQSSLHNLNSITIMDINGRIIFTFELDANEVDVSHLKAGMYLLKIESTQGSTTRKFIKK